MNARPPDGWRLLRRCAGALLLAALLLLAGLLLSGHADAAPRGVTVAIASTHIDQQAGR